MPGGQINDPSSGKHYSLLFLPATPSSPSRSLEGLFELTRRPSRALASPRALLLELQRHKDTVRCAALGAEVPGYRKQQLTQTLIVRLLKTHFFTSILDCQKSTEMNWVSDQTWLRTGPDGTSLPEKTPKQRLMDWVKDKMPDCPVNNFTSDWKDGKVSLTPHSVTFLVVESHFSVYVFRLFFDISLI